MSCFSPGCRGFTIWGVNPRHLGRTDQTRGLIATSAHIWVSRYENGPKDAVLVAMTNHLLYTDVFVSILERNLIQPAMGQLFWAWGRAEPSLMCWTDWVAPSPLGNFWVFLAFCCLPALEQQQPWVNPLFIACVVQDGRIWKWSQSWPSLGWMLGLLFQVWARLLTKEVSKNWFCDPS